MEFDVEVTRNLPTMKCAKDEDMETEDGGTARQETVGRWDGREGPYDGQMGLTPPAYGTGASFSGVSKEALMEALWAVQWMYDGERIGECRQRLCDHSYTLIDWVYCR